MRTNYKSRLVGKLVIGLTLLLALGISLTPVLAQEPDPPPTGQPAGVEEIDPPTEDALGEAVRDEAYVATDDLVDSKGGIIDIRDLAYVAARYNTADPSADLNFDGTVNILDLAILANSYNQAEPTAEMAGLTAPPELPTVEAGGEAFGAFELPVEPEGLEVEAQSYVTSRPLRVGVSLNYLKIYDRMDSYSAPDPFALVSVGGVSARTSTLFDRYVSWPAWRLGWWRYYSFPRAAWDAPEAAYYTVPIRVELRDNDGYFCYGYYGCRNRYQLADISPQLYTRTKNLTFYPSSCQVVDENGTETSGYWLDSNRCRVYLHTWGTEWPRAYLNYYIDALWE